MFARLLSLLLLLPLVHGLEVVYLTGDEAQGEYAVSTPAIVHVTMPASCELLCTFSFIYEKNGPMDLRISVPAGHDTKLFVQAENTAALVPAQGARLDFATLTAYEDHFRVMEQTESEKVIVVNIAVQSLEGGFSIHTTPTFPYTFWQLSFGFGALVQQARMWTGTFFFPYLFLVILLIDFLAWPLKRQHVKHTTVLVRLTTASLWAWLIDTLAHGLLALETTADRHLSSLLLHIVSNLFLLFTIRRASFSTDRRQAWMGFACACSLLVGGGGFYIASACLALDVVLYRPNAPGKQGGLLCKEV
jgi:hypothetical protein